MNYIYYCDENNTLRLEKEFIGIEVHEPFIVNGHKEKGWIYPDSNMPEYPIYTEIANRIFIYVGQL